MKRYPAYKASGVEWFEKLPSSWGQKKLKHISKVVNGSTPKSGVKEYWDGDIVWITPNDLGHSNGSKVKDSLKKITTMGLNSCGTTLTPPRSIILSTRAPIGHIALTSVETCTSQGCKTVVLNNEECHSRYLFYYLLSSKTNLQSLGQGSTFTELSSQNLKDFKSPFPSNGEQQKIANYLDHKTHLVDTLIEKKQKQIELLKEQRASIINQAVTKGQNPNVKMKDSGIEWLGEVPEHWKIQKTKYLFELSTEKAPENNEFELLSIYADIGVRPRKELEERGNKASTTDGYFIVKKGDIIVNKLLAWMGAIGCSVYDGVTSPAYDILREIKPLNSFYYHYLFRGGLCLTEFKKRSRGIMDMRLRLYFDEFGQILLPYPPEDEQNSIVEYIKNQVEKVKSLIAKQQEQIQLLREYRTTLISEVVTGKIDVRDEVTQ